MKKAGEDTTQIFGEMKKVSDKISEMDAQLKDNENELNDILMFIPNLTSLICSRWQICRTKC